MTYTKTKKRIMADRQKADWEQRLEIFRLRNQGWSFEQIGEKLDCTKQNASSIYHKIKDMTIEEIEKMLEITK